MEFDKKDKQVQRTRFSEWDTEFGVTMVKGIWIVAPILWTASIAYATWQLYLSADEFLPFQKDRLLNPGPFSWILGRGRDTSDSDWALYTSFLANKYVYYVICYLLANILIGNLSPKIKLIVSTIFSMVLCVHLFGTKGLVFLMLQPIVYSCLKVLTKRKAVIWAYSLVGLIVLNIKAARLMLVEPFVSEIFFTIVTAWTFARCISFTLDTWTQHSVNPKHQISIENLASALCYIFYFPLLTHGPIIPYSTFQKDLLQGNGVPISGREFIKKISKVIGLLVLNEVIISYLYFGSFSLTIQALRRMNLWALGGVVYWLGQFFMLKYAVFYGLNSCIAEKDGVQMPPLPKCPAHIHRYSVLWKEFDPGLYEFILRYVYIPSIEEIATHWNHKISSPAMQKWVASLISFIYIYVWHSTVFEVFVWSAINFLGISIEKVGVWLRERIDGVNLSVTGERHHPKEWDVLIEPLVTVPLAGMSILNSTIFCGNLDAANIFAIRLVFYNPNLIYLLLILYTLTHTSIGVRTIFGSNKKKDQKIM